MSTLCGMDSKRYRIITLSDVLDLLRAGNYSKTFAMDWGRWTTHLAKWISRLRCWDEIPHMENVKVQYWPRSPSNGFSSEHEHEQRTLVPFRQNSPWRQDVLCTVDYSTSHLFSCLLFVMTSSGQCSCRYVFFSTPIVETKSFIDGGHLQKKCFSSRRLGRLLHHGDKVWKTLQSLG